MTETVGVIIGTFGDEVWKERALNAIASVVRQTHKATECVAVHAETLERARNQGAELVGDCDWLIFLDADDELDPGYIAAMLAGNGDVRQPATFGIYEDGTTDDEPVVIPQRDLEISNYIVIGAMVRSSIFFDAGGFHNHAALEDWCLWRRVVLTHGASVGVVPDAVYRVHVQESSRNNDPKVHGHAYHVIRQGCVT